MYVEINGCFKLFSFCSYTGVEAEEMVHCIVLVVVVVEIERVRRAQGRKEGESIDYIKGGVHEKNAVAWK